MADVNARATLRVSVILPTYNRAAYLQEALASVFAQTLAPWEVIVIDDGSTDNTQDIMATYDTRLRYFRQAHQGVAAARNYGLKMAQGDIMAWLDADDLWESDFLATLLPLLESDSQIDGCYSGCAYIDAAGDPLPQTDQRIVASSKLFSALTESNFLTTPAIIVRKRCFAQVGDFDTQLSICEDYDMWLRLAKQFTIVGLSVPLVKIRVHGANTVRDTAAFSRFRIHVVQKHFGDAEGDPAMWPEEKRCAYAMAFRDVALKHSQDGEDVQKWQYLEKAIAIWPGLLARLDTFYELACGEQPRGRRGLATSLDIAGHGVAMLSGLDALFEKAGLSVSRLRHTAYGNAYLALAMLSDQAGQWGSARRYMLRALRAYPPLVLQFGVVRRLLKLTVGRRVVDGIRR